MAEGQPADDVSRSQAIVGRTITRVDFDYDEGLRLFFDDGSMLFVEGMWHNDSTAGTAVALLGPDEPKSYSESKDFPQLVYDRSWDS